MNEQQLQSLRNLGNECEEAADEIVRLRAALAAQGVPDGCRVADVGFRWDGEKQQHFPNLLIEFDPAPVNGGSNAKGWRDRDAMAAMLAATPAPAQAQQAEPPTVPHPGSEQASKAIDTELEARGWPTNTKNAARAGYEACRKLAGIGASSGSKS